MPNGNKYIYEVDGHKHNCGSLDDMALELVNICQTKFHREKWYSEFADEVNKDPNSTTTDGFNQVAKSLMKVKLIEALDAKREYRDANQSSAMPSAFEGDIVISKRLPSKVFNAEDLDLISGLCYCQKDGMIYFKDKLNNFTLIGPPSALLEKKSDAVCDASRLLSESLATKLGVKEFNIWAWMWDVCKKATELFMEKRKDIEDGKSRGKLPSDIEIEWDGAKTNVKDLFGWYSDSFDSQNFVDDLHSKIVGKLIDDWLPSTIFREGLASLGYENKNNNFIRYWLGPASGKRQFTMSDFIVAIFSEATLINKIPNFNNPVYIIQDDRNKVSKYKLIQNWKNYLPPNQFNNLADCKILNTFLDKYSDDEKQFIMAWAYSVMHPSLGEGIGLLIKTGGGAFKTNGYASMLSALLSKMYGAEQDELSYSLVRSSWTKDGSQLLESQESGISKCALAINDECDEKSIEKYKEMSGSTSNVGVQYTYKKVYQVPVSMRVYCRWLFLTNQQITINDTDGVFERRLAIIDRMDIKKLPKPYTSLEYPIYLNRELLCFYNLAEKSYNDLRTKYSDLVDAATQMDFAKNLKQAYREDDKIYIYYKLTEDMKDGDMIRVNDFNEKLKYLCDLEGVNEKGMKNWIRDTDKISKKCEFSKGRTIKGERVRVHILYKLLPEYEPKFEDDTQNEKLGSDIDELCA